MNAHLNVFVGYPDPLTNRQRGYSEKNECIEVFGFLIVLQINPRLILKRAN